MSKSTRFQEREELINEMLGAAFLVQDENLSDQPSDKYRMALHSLRFKCEKLSAYDAPKQETISLGLLVSVACVMGVILLAFSTYLYIYSPQMKMNKLQIRNFQHVTSLDLDLNGRDVLLLGKNGVGKSSVINAVFSALTGKTPDKMLKAGENSGSIEIGMENFVVKGNFNSKKNTWSSFVVETLDGAPYRSPREFLKEKLGTIDFDVNRFLQETPKKQIDFVKQLANIDFTDIDEEYTKVYHERTFVNRRLKEVEAQQVTYESSLVNQPKVDRQELNEKIVDAKNHNWEISKQNSKQADLCNEIILVSQRLAKLNEDLATVTSWLENNEPIDVIPLTEQMNIATQINEAIDRAKAGAAKKFELDELLDKQSQLNIRLAEIDAIKKKIIAESPLPVPGMTFDQDSLYINGIPFNQVNTATKIIAGLQMQLPLMNQIRVCSFDASQLDDDNLAKVQAWAKENDLQLFIERVERNQEGLKIEFLEA